MAGVSAHGFSGYLGGLRLITGYFMGFLGWVNECGATARCFMGFCGLWGFT